MVRRYKCVAPVAVAVLVLSGSPGSTLLAQASTLPSQAEVQAMVDAGEYAKALPLLNRLVVLKDAAAEPYDIMTCHLLKAECHLRLKNAVATKVALVTAMDYGYKVHNIDGVGKAATVLVMMQRATAGKYKPAAIGDATNAGPFDILDLPARKAAAPFLYQDERTAIDEQVRQSKSWKSIQPMLAVSEKFPALRGLERAGRGTTEATERLGVQLARLSADLIFNELENNADDLGRIDNRAGELITVQVPTPSGMRDVQRPRGLSREDKTAMTKIRKTAAAIPDAINKLNKAFASPLPIDRLSSWAADTVERVDKMLDKYKMY